MGLFPRSWRRNNQKEPQPVDTGLGHILDLATANHDNIIRQSAHFEQLHTELRERIQQLELTVAKLTNEKRYENTLEKLLSAEKRIFTKAKKRAK